MNFVRTFPALLLAVVGLPCAVPGQDSAESRIGGHLAALLATDAKYLEAHSLSTGDIRGGDANQRSLFL